MSFFFVVFVGFAGNYAAFNVAYEQELTKSILLCFPNGCL